MTTNAPAQSFDDILLELDEIQQAQDVLDQDMAQRREFNQGNMGEFRKGVNRAFQGSQASGFGMAALLGDAVGSNELRDAGFEGYERNTGEASLYPADVPEASDITSVGDFVDWFSGAIGETLVSVAEIGIGSATGAGLAVSAGKTALKKKVAGEVAKKLAKRGAQTGVVGTSYPLEAGGMYGEDAEKHGLANANPLSAGIIGAVSAGTEVLAPEGKFVGNLLGLLNKNGGEITKKSAIELGKRIVAASGQGMIEEAGQESVQAFLGALNEFVNDPEEELLSTERIVEYLNAGAKGAVGGAGFGLASLSRPQPNLDPLQETGQNAAKPPGDAEQQAIDDINAMVANISPATTRNSKTTGPNQDLWNDIAQSQEALASQTDARSEQAQERTEAQRSTEYRQAQNSKGQKPEQQQAFDRETFGKGQGKDITGQLPPLQQAAYDPAMDEFADDAVALSQQEEAKRRKHQPKQLPAGQGFELKGDSYSGSDANVAAGQGVANLENEGDTSFHNPETEAAAAKEAEKLVRENPITRVQADIKKQGGLNHDRFAQDYGPETVSQINKKYPGLISKNGPLNIDEIAGEHDFATGDDLVQSILAAPTIKSETQRLAQQWNEEHGQGDQEAAQYEQDQAKAALADKAKEMEGVVSQAKSMGDILKLRHELVTFFESFPEMKPYRRQIKKAVDARSREIKAQPMPNSRNPNLGRGKTTGPQADMMNTFADTMQDVAEQTKNRNVPKKADNLDTLPERAQERGGNGQVQKGVDSVQSGGDQDIQQAIPDVQGQSKEEFQGVKAKDGSKEVASVSTQGAEPAGKGAPASIAQNKAVSDSVGDRAVNRKSDLPGAGTETAPSVKGEASASLEHNKDDDEYRYFGTKVTIKPVIGARVKELYAEKTGTIVRALNFRQDPENVIYEVEPDGQAGSHFRYTPDQIIINELVDRGANQPAADTAEEKAAKANENLLEELRDAEDSLNAAAKDGDTLRVEKETAKLRELIKQDAFKSFIPFIQEWYQKHAINAAKEELADSAVDAAIRDGSKVAPNEAFPSFKRRFEKAPTDAQVLPAGLESIDIEGGEYLTNGHFVIKRNMLRKPLVNRYVEQIAKGIPKRLDASTAERLLKKPKDSISLDYKGYFEYKSNSDTHPLGFFVNDEWAEAPGSNAFDPVFANVNIIEYLLRDHQNLSFQIDRTMGGGSPILISVDGEIVGAVMPFDMKNSWEAKAAKTVDFGMSMEEVQTETKQGQESAEQEEGAEEVAENSAGDLAGHDATIERLMDGELALGEFKQAFQTLKVNEAEIRAELTGLTKNQLLGRLGAYSAAMHKNDKKDHLVRVAFDSMLTDFYVHGDTFSYSMGGIMPAMASAVERTTKEDLEAFATRIKESRKAREEKAEQRKEALKDPKTLDDYITFLRDKMEDMSFKEAYMSMTAEQRATYDSLAAESTREKRLARKEQQKTEVRAAGQEMTGEVLETKHTKTGEDLFVVKAAERVDREVYNQWNTTAKKMGGHYSSFRGKGAIPGFQFKTRENAEAFLAYLGGNVEQAKDAVQARRDAFADDRSQTAVERLEEMATRLEEKAKDSLSQGRLTNTARRARFAAAAEKEANKDVAMAETMRNIAKAIGNGSAKLLDKVRQKIQVEMLQSFVRNARYQELRDKKVSSGDGKWEIEVEKVTPNTASYAEFPQYTFFRSDLATLGRQLSEINGTKKIGKDILKVADDVTKEYLKFAKENILSVATFTKKDGSLAAFSTKGDAERAIQRSGFKGQAIVLPVKRGENLIIMSPSLAREKGVWEGDDDKKITLKRAFGDNLVQKVHGLSQEEQKGVTLPWRFDNVHTSLKRLSAIGIETPAEFRAALREFVENREAPKELDRVKQLELGMTGRVNDGMDFFPTPASIAQDMVDTADIKKGMTVLEPSAGMGHIAEQIREAGVDPDVLEMSGKRRELLEAKGFNVVGNDFLEDVEGKYDRIIMNPPFSERRDAEHIRHAYELLNPGGRIVAIMGEGVFFGQDKKAKEFRDWLDSVGGTSEKLADGSFMDKSLPVTTGVNARLVVIDKGSENARFSKSVLSPTPITNQADISAEMAASIGEKRTAALLDSGRVNIVGQTEIDRIVDAAERGDLRFMTAYHGSPHDFSEFSLDAIGSGEGAQVYGYGLYFAGNREVAEWYQRKLTSDEQVMSFGGRKYYGTNVGWSTDDSINDTILGSDSPASLAMDAIMDYGYSAQSFLEEDLEYIEQHGEDFKGEKQGIAAALELIKTGEVEAATAGALYQVELAPREDEYLLWDKPISEQGGKIEEIINNNLEIEWADHGVIESGRDLYDALVDEHGSQESASEYLHSLGIRGIKYLDGMSRSNGEGNYNYVIFNDADVKIEIKYSKDGHIQGVTLPDGTVYLNKDGIAKGQVYPTLLHELGVHAGMRGLLGKQYNKLLKQFELMARAGNKKAKAAMARVPKGTAAAHRLEEAVAYFVEANPSLPFSKKVIAAIRQFLRKLGLGLTFKEADIVYVAQAAVKREARNAGRHVRQAKRSSVAAMRQPEQAGQHQGKMDFAKDARSFLRGGNNGADKEAFILAYSKAFGVSARQLQLEYDEARNDYVGTNGWLKAPDGSQTKLSEREWVLTQTPRFQSWFKDSKVLDENGEPLILYHGSPTMFKSEDPDAWTFLKKFIGKNTERPASGMGFFFTAWRPLAKTSAKGGEIAKVFMRLENPYRMKENEYTGFDSVKSAIKRRSELINQGYDGVVFDTGSRYTDYHISFESNQAKLTSNSGEFGETGDIRFSRTAATDIATNTQEGKDAATFVAKHAPAKDRTFLERIISSGEYTMKKHPAAWRAFQAMVQRGDDRHDLEITLLGDFQEMFTKMKKRARAVYDKVGDYLVKYDIENSRKRTVRLISTWAVVDENGVEVARENSYSEAIHASRALAQEKGEERTHTITEKEERYELREGKDVLSQFETRDEAIEAMLAAEQSDMTEAGHSKAAMKAVYSFRRMTNRAFDELFADTQKVIDQYRELGLDEPTTEVIDESKRWVVIVDGKNGKKVGKFFAETQAEAEAKAAALPASTVKRQGDDEIRKHVSLSEAMALMGDLRGSYFPRKRDSGAYILIAKKEGKPSILKEFDLYASQKHKFTDPETGEVINKKLSRALNAGAALFNNISFSPANRERKRLERKGYKVSIEVNKAMPEDVFSAAKLMSSMNAMLSEAKKGSDKAGILQSNAKEVNRIMTMAVADTFKARGFLSSRIKRSSENWEGYETDPLRAGLIYAKGLAAGIAKREAAVRVAMALSGRDISWKQWKEDNPSGDYADYEAFVDERRLNPKEHPGLYNEAMSLQEEVFRNEERADRIMGTMKSLATLKYLGFKVSSAAINMTNMVTGVPGTISGRTGVSLKDAMVHTAKSAEAYRKFKMKKKGDPVSADDIIFLDIISRGWDEAQFNQEAAKELRGGKLANAYNSTMGVAMYMFGATEKANRAMTIFAAYKALEQSGPDLSIDGRMEMARDISNRSHGLYGKETAPSWTRGSMNPLKLAWTFQKFTQNYMMNAAEMGLTHGQWKAASFVLFSPIALAGATASIPTALALAAAKALGIGGDEPEEEFYKWAEQTFGSDRFARQGLFGLAGIDLRGSLSPNSPLPKNMKELLGAPGSVFVDVSKGYNYMRSGETARAFESLAPHGFGNVSKSIREGSEGVTTGGYGQVFYGDEPLRADQFEQAIRFFSFNPARISGIREKQWHERKVKNKFTERRSSIRKKAKRLALQGKLANHWPELMKEMAYYNDLVKGTGRKDLPLMTMRGLNTSIRRAKKPSKTERYRKVS